MSALLRAIAWMDTQGRCVRRTGMTAGLPLVKMVVLARTGSRPSTAHVRMDSQVRPQKSLFLFAYSILRGKQT